MIEYTEKTNRQMNYISNKVLLLNRENEQGNLTMKNIVDVAVAEMSTKLNKGFKSNFDTIFRTTDAIKKDVEEDEAALEKHIEGYDKLKFTCDMNFSVMVKQEEL